MKFSFGVVVCLSSLVLSHAAIAADMPASFDYQGQTNLGLAPETPDDVKKCRPVGYINDDQSEEQVGDTQTELLSTSTDLDRKKRRCGALTLATVGTAGYIERQSSTTSGPQIGGLLLTGAVVGLALLDEGGGSPSGADPVPFPIPGAGFLSYLVLGGSGIALWLRRRAIALKQNVRDLVAKSGDARIEAA